MASPRHRKPRYVGDYTGIGEMLRTNGMADEMHRRADAGKAYAEAIAPRESGAYSRSFYAFSQKYAGGYEKDRARGVLGNDDPAALWVEIGSTTVKAHRTLRRAMLDVMGA